MAGRVRQVNFRISEAKYNRINRICQAKDITLTAFVTAAIDAALGNEGKAPSLADIVAEIKRLSDRVDALEQINEKANDLSKLQIYEKFNL